MEQILENSIYATQQEKDDFLANHELVASSFYLNVVGFLSLYTISHKLGVVKNYMKDQQVQLKNIVDDSNDLLVSLKAYSDIGGLTPTTTTNLTKLLAKIKAGGLTSKDMDENVIRQLVSEFKIETHKPAPLIYKAVKHFIDGDGLVHLARSLYYTYKGSKLLKGVTVEFQKLCYSYTPIFNKQDAIDARKDHFTGNSPLDSLKTINQPASIVHPSAPIPQTVVPDPIDDVIDDPIVTPTTVTKVAKVPKVKAVPVIKYTNMTAVIEALFSAASDEEYKQVFKESYAKLTKSEIMASLELSEWVKSLRISSDQRYALLKGKVTNIDVVMKNFYPMIKKLSSQGVAETLLEILHENSNDYQEWYDKILSYKINLRQLVTTSGMFQRIVDSELKKNLDLIISSDENSIGEISKKPFIGHVLMTTIFMGNITLNKGIEKLMLSLSYPDKVKYASYLFLNNALSIHMILNNEYIKKSDMVIISERYADSHLVDFDKIFPNGNKFFENIKVIRADLLNILNSLSGETIYIKFLQVINANDTESFKQLYNLGDYNKEFLKVIETNGKLPSDIILELLPPNIQDETLTTYLKSIVTYSLDLSTLISLDYLYQNVPSKQQDISNHVLKTLERLQIKITKVRGGSLYYLDRLIKIDYEAEYKKYIKGDDLIRTSILSEFIPKISQQTLDNTIFDNAYVTDILDRLTETGGDPIVTDMITKAFINSNNEIGKLIFLNDRIIAFTMNREKLCKAVYDSLSEPSKQKLIDDLSNDLRKPSFVINTINIVDVIGKEQFLAKSNLTREEKLSMLEKRRHVGPLLSGDDSLYIDALTNINNLKELHAHNNIFLDLQEGHLSPVIALEILSFVDKSKKSASEKRLGEYFTESALDVIANNSSNPKYQQLIESKYQDFSTDNKKYIFDKILSASLMKNLDNEMYGDHIDIKPFEKLTQQRLGDVLKYNNVDLSKTNALPFNSNLKINDINNQVVNVKALTDIKADKLTLTDIELEDMTIEYDAFNRRKHGDTAVIIKKAFDVSIPEMEAGYNKFLAKYDNDLKKANYMPTMFHGTGSVAASFILRYGFAIISSDDPALAGRMIGDGIYVTDVLDKASQYISDNGYIQGRRNIGNKGYLFECSVLLGTHKKEFSCAGTGTQYDERGCSVISPEWAVFYPNQQIKIRKAFLTEVVDVANVDAMRKARGLNEDSIIEIKSFKSFINEGANGKKHAITYIFRNGYIPVSNDLSVPFEEFKASKFGPDVKSDLSAQGPSVIVYNDIRSATYFMHSDYQLTNDKKMFKEYKKFLGIK